MQPLREGLREPVRQGSGHDRRVIVVGSLENFGLGRIGNDQLADYAQRKGMPVEIMARWLAPNLAED